MTERTRYQLFSELVDAIHARYAPNNHRLALEAALVECADPEKLAAKIEDMRRAAA